MVFEKVRRILEEQLGFEEEDITMESSISNDLGADDLDKVEIIMSIEEEFDIEIPDSDVEKLNTVGDYVEYIKNNS